MAGMFYSLEETAEKLNLNEDQLKELVQEGKLREFRDGANLLFKVDEVESLVPDLDAIEAEAPAEESAEPEAAVPEAEAAEEIELDLSEPEAVEIEEVPEPAAEEPEVTLEAPDEEPEISEPAAEEEEAVKLEAAEPEEEAVELEGLDDIADLEELSDSNVPSLEDLDAEIAELQEPVVEDVITEESTPEAPAAEAPAAEAPEPEAPKSSEFADSEILLAPETGAPLMSNDLTDADTALTGLGTNILSETDEDYAITDDTMAETSIPMGTGGTTPEVPLEEIEGDVNLDTFGSGSGLLDLSLQADDTSLGGILDEIYTAEDEGKEMGEPEGDSAAAMAAEADQAVPEEDIAVPQAAAAPEMALARPMMEAAPDAQSNMLGMLLFLPLAIVIYTIAVAWAGKKEVMPSILAPIQAFIWYIMGGAAVIAVLVAVVAFMFTGEREAKPKKEKKAKVKKEKKPKAKKEKKPKEPKKPKEKKPKKPKKGKKGFLRLK